MLSTRNLIIVTKVLTGYFLFYALVKFVAVFTGEAVKAPNLMLGFLMLLLSVIGFYIIKTGGYKWFFASLGVVLVILLRIFEEDILYYLSSVI